MSVSVASRRRPWPFSIEVEGVGFMLKPQLDGQMVSRKVQPLSAAPTSYEYSSNSPFVEQTYEFRHTHLGAGERFQPRGSSRRYKIARRVDSSINGRWIKGPHFHSENLIIPDNRINQYIRAIYQGTDSLFTLNGRYLLVRVSDGHAGAGAWSIIGDAGVGNVYTQAAVFQHAGATSPSLYVCRATGNLSHLSTAAAAPTVYGAGTGPAGEVATNIEVVGKELWVGGGSTGATRNLIQKVELDPGITANYAATIRVGDGTAAITWMRQNKNILHVFKEDGTYTISATGVAQELFPFLRRAKHADNGKNASVFADELYVPYRDTFFKLDKDENYKAIGIEQMLDTDAEVRGYVTAFAGHNTWFGYETIYNEITDTTYLGKYGTWIESEDNRSNDIIQHVDVHHLSIAEWTGKKATTMEIVPMPGTNDRLYIGFDDGTSEWTWLPKHSPNPTIDPLCEFTAADSYIDQPDFHGGFAADRKIFRGFSAFGPVLDNNNKVKVQYRLNDSATWLDIDAANLYFTVSGQRIDFPSEANAPIARTLQHRIYLINADTTDTPIVDGIAVHSLMRPAFIIEHTFTIDAKSKNAKYDGSCDRRSAEEIRDTILSVCGRSGTTTFRLPYEDEEELIIQDYVASLNAKLKRYASAEWEITIKGIQFKSLTSAESGETLSELTYGQLEQYTYGQLEVLL